MSLLLLFNSSSDTTPTRILPPRNICVETLQSVRTSTPKAAVALLILLAPTLQTGDLSATMGGLTLTSAASTTVEATLAQTVGGLTLSSDASMPVATADQVLSRTVNVTGTIETHIPKRRSHAPVLFADPIGGTLTATLGGLTLTADAATSASPGIVDSSVVRGIRRNVVLEQATQLPKRKSVTALLISPAPIGADLSASFPSLTLASDASTAAAQSDLYLGGETRAEAYPAAPLQWSKRLHWHLLTTFNYPVANLAVGTPIGGLTLASVATVAAPASGDVATAIGGLTLTSQSATVVTADVSTAIGGLTLSAQTSEVATNSGAFDATLGGLTLSSDASAPVEATLSTMMGGITLLARQGTQQSVGSVDVTLGGLTLAALGTATGAGFTPDEILITLEPFELVVSAEPYELAVTAEPFELLVEAT